MNQEIINGYFQDYKEMLDFEGEEELFPPENTGIDLFTFSEDRNGINFTFIGLPWELKRSLLLKDEADSCDDEEWLEEHKLSVTLSYLRDDECDKFPSIN